MWQFDRITDWPARAHAAHYRVDLLAKQVGVSQRTLERFIMRRFGSCPKAWLHELRMQCARELLADDSKVKEIIKELGYRHPHNFARPLNGKGERPRIDIRITKFVVYKF